MLRICHCPIPAKTAGSTESPTGRSDGPATTLSVPPRWLAGDGRTVVQTPPPATASAVGSFPTWTSRVERVAGSMRATVPSTPFATQTAPSP
jgi:hypothetical protein